MKKRKIKKIKILLIMLFIILVILIVFVKFLGKEKNIAVYDGKLDEQIAENYLKDKVVPQGVYQFSREYKGNISKDIFYTKLNDMLNYMMELSQDIEKEKIEKFFQKNSEDILEYLGIEKQEEFIKLYNFINEKNIKNATFSHCKIVENTFKIEGSYTKFNMIFYYDNEIELELQISLLNKEASKKPLLKVIVL